MARGQVLKVFDEALAGRRSPSIKVSYLSEVKQSLGTGGVLDVVDVLINATPLRDANGVACGALGIAQDMSTSRCVDVDLERARVTQVCCVLAAACASLLAGPCGGALTLQPLRNRS
jgi:hypothetical protein